MPRDEIEAALLRHLNRPGAAPRGEIHRESLLLDGVLDSLALVDLLAFIDRTWGLRVANRDVRRTCFGSVAILSGFLDARLRERR